MLFPLFAPLQIDDTMLALCEDFQEALKSSGWKQGAAAAAMRISPTKLSEQLEGHAPFTAVARYPVLGVQFACEFHKRRLHRLGHEIVPVDVAELLVRVRRLCDVQTRMLKVTLTRRKKVKVC